MRKNFVILITFITAILFLLSSSPWEGAGAVAPAGELPATGHFIATNSFPRNSIVDITNLETGKSTRAIVAGGLDSQGLLAIVSRDAAELMGMREGSISRIRMVQPQDTIAQMRFSQGMAADTPAYDSGNVITEQMYRTEPYRPPAAEPEPMPTPRNTTGPGYVLEPEWRTRETIVNVDRFPEPEQRSTVVQPFVNEKITEDEPVNLYPYDYEYFAEEEAEEELEFLYPYDYEYFVEEVIEEEPLYLAEQPVVVEENLNDRVEYYFVPAEERPPENTIYGIDPSVIILDIAPVAEKEPEKPFDPPPAERPATTTSVTSAPVERVSSAPRITEIDTGFYVQLAAVRTSEEAETLKRQIMHDVRLSDFRIDRNYSPVELPVVSKDGSIWYQILYGPFLNQGESAAVQQRFVSIGYKDAFVTKR